MGGKSQPQMPPPIDNSVTEAADKAEEKLEKEKQAAIGTKKECMVQFLHLVKV